MSSNGPSHKTKPTNPFAITEAHLELERKSEELYRKRKELAKRFQKPSPFEGVAELGAAFLGLPPMNDANTGVEPFRPEDVVLSPAELVAMEKLLGENPSDLRKDLAKAAILHDRQAAEPYFLRDSESFTGDPAPPNPYANAMPPKPVALPARRPHPLPSGGWRGTTEGADINSEIERPGTRPGTTISPKGQQPYVAHNYSIPEMLRAMRDNAPSDAGDVAYGLTDRAVHPMESLDEMRKFDRGLLQLVIPGEQEYETEYTRPALRKWAMDWGINTYSNGHVEFDKEQFKRRLAEQPVQSAMDLLLVKSILTRHFSPGEIAHIAELVHKGKSARAR